MSKLDITDENIREYVNRYLEGDEEILKYGLIGEWDVSNVTNMQCLFECKIHFNEPLNNWNVSNVTDMNGMFMETSFNQPLNNWDVSKVKDMSCMFYQSEFNQPINNWDVSKVKDMEAMFANSKFNQPLNDWDVRNVSCMDHMFNDSQFNQPLDKWNVRNIDSMRFMFYKSHYNQPLTNWIIYTNYTDVSYMFDMAHIELINKPIFERYESDDEDNCYEEIEAREITGLPIIKNIYKNVEKCSICIECINKKEKVVLNCGHIIHRECANMIKNKLCPECRQRFNRSDYRKI